MKTYEKNLLVVRFMDYEVKGWDFIFPPQMQHLYKPVNRYEFENGVYNFTSDLTSLEFNTSWDWLMPVIRKILFKGYTLEGVEKMLKVQDAFHSCKIETTYEAVIEFILWFNKNNK